MAVPLSVASLYTFFAVWKRVNCIIFFNNIQKHIQFYPITFHLNLFPSQQSVVFPPEVVIAIIQLSDALNIKGIPVDLQIFLIDHRASTIPHNCCFFAVKSNELQILSLSRNINIE